MSANYDDMIRKISALLAKAEKTDNEAEAATFYAKAQELMLRYAVDEETIRTASGKKVVDIIRDTFVYSTSDANLPGKQSILGSIAEANRCVLFMVKDGSRHEQRATLVGFKDDVEYSKLLYAAVLGQAQRAANHAFKTRLFETSGRKVFITQFLLGYGSRVNVRLYEANLAAETAVAGGSALVVNRKAAVQEWISANMTFGKGRARSLKSDLSAQLAGDAAGRSADLDIRRKAAVAQGPLKGLAAG